MASSSSTDSRRRFSSQLIVKEGYLNRRGGIIKSWSRRYFVLNKQSLVYFRREQDINGQSLKSGLSPQGRIFLSDIINIEKEGLESRKTFVFALKTKKRVVLLQAFSDVERDDWVSAIQTTLESEGEAERKDPFRRTLRCLAPGLKRVTLVKDPEKGIGCTIKSAGGHIFVNRIVEDGPIAHTGVLKPDDELLDVNGVALSGLTVAQVGQVIRMCPDEFLATVKPITALKKVRPPDVARVNYVTVVPILGLSSSTADSSCSESSRTATMAEYASDDSVDDGEEDEGSPGPPPPIPPQTDDIFLTINNESLLTGSQQGNKDKLRSHSVSECKSDVVDDVVLSKKPRRVHVYEDIRTNYVDVIITDKPTTPKAN